MKEKNSTRNERSESLLYIFELGETELFLEGQNKDWVDVIRLLSPMDFNMLTGPLTAWELSCVEIEDNACTDAHIEFSNVKIDSESIGGVVFPHTCTHLL